MAVKQSLPDLFLIDIHVPKPDGVTLYKAFRQAPQTRDIPAILMTGEALLDSILGAAAEGLGSEPVLRKPLDLKVLLDRVREALERGAAGRPEDGKPAPEPRCYALDGLRFYPEMGRLVLDDKAVRLNCQEALLLEMFLRRPGMLYSHDCLWENVWHSSKSKNWKHILDNRIFTLRGKLGAKWSRRLACRKKQGFVLCQEANLDGRVGIL